MPKLEKNSPVNRIGIFGGTFDPIHNGHIETAKHLADFLNLDEVTLLPCKIPPHKESTSVSSHHRTKMVELVCENNPQFKVDLRELKADQTSYTVNSLKDIRNEYPEAIIYFFIGMDSLLTFTHWFKWQEIFNLCHIVVCSRPSFSLEDANEETLGLIEQYQKSFTVNQKENLTGNLYFADDNYCPISSTEIRQLIVNGSDYSHLMPQFLINYIQQHNLYSS